MNAETLTALEGSIRKWDCICQGIGVDDGINNCPLCELFYAYNCDGCPVAKHCGNWEFQEWSYIAIALSGGTIPDSLLPTKNAAMAEAELIYLLKLLPEGHSWREMI